MHTRSCLSFWSFLVLILTPALALTDCSCDDGKDCYQTPCGPPQGSAGEDQVAVVGRTVALNGEARLPPSDYEPCNFEADKLLFQWEQVEGPAVDLTDANSRSAYFVPTQIGEYRFRFQVVWPEGEFNCEEATSLWDTVVVTVVDVTCDPPTADGGPDQNVGMQPGTPVSVILDGTASHPVLQEGCDLNLIGYSWTVVSKPAGSFPVIHDANQAQATAELSALGEYIFQLEVQDDGGTDGRTDTHSDTVLVTVVEDCGTDLNVTVIDAATGDPMVGVTVDVLDGAGASNSSTTDASGLAAATGLDAFGRRTVTASSGEMVPPLPGPVGPERLKYEITTVLEQCGSEITIPMRRTISGEAAPMGAIVAKVPRSLFDILPHSWRCTTACDTDADCDAEYYCENEPGTPCGPNPPTEPRGLCTPRSLLPSFSLGSSEISGQFRAIMAVPLLEGENFTYQDLNRIFAPPPEAGGAWPGNLATDDTFHNRLASAWGRNFWGDTCWSVADCPNTTDYICEDDETGTSRCRDKNPMRNIRLDLPAGSPARFVLVMGIVDIYMDEFLPELLQLLISGPTWPDLSLIYLATFDFHTLHVCPLWTDVTANQVKDISLDLSSLREDHCWNVDYSVMERVVTTPSGATLFRTAIITNDKTVVEPDFSAFDPTSVNADTRLCSWLPDTVSYEVMCDQGGYIESCDPPQIHDIPLPPDTECSFPYGVSLTALDVPVGHAEIPEGGRVFAGFEFNRCATHQNIGAEFLVPVEALDGSIMLSATQMYFRNLLRTDLGPFWEMPGYLTAQDRWAVMPATATLPPFATTPSLDSPPPDAGLSIEFIFDPEDPTVWPDPAWKRVFAQAIGLGMPQAAANPMTYELTETTLAGENLKGVILSKVDYAAAITWVDPWWRVYMPAGTQNITLPAGESPFLSGDYVWISPFGAGYDQPFDYDLFPTDILLGPMSQYSEDSWAVIAP